VVAVEVVAALFSFVPFSRLLAFWRLAHQKRKNRIYKDLW